MLVIGLFITLFIIGEGALFEEEEPDDCLGSSGPQEASGCNAKVNSSYGDFALASNSTF